MGLLALREFTSCDVAIITILIAILALALELAIHKCTNPESIDLAPWRRHFATMNHDQKLFFILAKASDHVNPSRYISLLLLALLAFGAQRVQGDWPEFRGPWGDGHAAAPGDSKLIGLPLHWSETNNVKWKVEIPHRGWSTPVVMGGQVWLTTATEDGHDFFALDVDAETGKIRFNEKVFHSDNPESLGNGASMNCYATPSPVIEPGRVYVHFGSFGTACLDTETGKILWKRNDLPCRAEQFRWSAPEPKRLTAMTR